MRFFVAFILLSLSITCFGQFGFSKKKGNTKREVASNKASKRVVIDHRDAFSRKKHKGNNVKATRYHKKSFFASKKKKQQNQYARKTRNAGGFQANKSRYRKQRKSGTSDAFARNPKKSRSSSRKSGKPGKAGTKGRRR